MYESRCSHAAIFAAMNLTFHLNGHSMAYNPAQATGLPLLLLHGFCEDQSVWGALLPHLPDVPLLTLDLPGFGQSEPAAEPTMEAFAEAVKTALELHGITRCVLTGHSMGGYVALEFAARWPEMLAGLGLFNSHPFTDNEERKTARKRGIETVLGGKRDLYVAQLFPNLFAPSFQKQHPEVIQALTEQGKKQTATGIAHALQAMLDREDHQPTLMALRSPAMFILGKMDVLIPHLEGTKAGLLPDMSMLQILPEVGHMGMWEAPKGCAQTLVGFYHWCALRNG